MNYAGFWQRFCAALVDFIVLLPLQLLMSGIGSQSKLAAIMFVIPTTAGYCAYAIYYHGRYGQTLGKKFMRIQVRRLTGERIGWREAWLRSSVDLAFVVSQIIASFIALAAITDADYYNWSQRIAKFQALEPSWLAWTGPARMHEGVLRQE